MLGRIHSFMPWFFSATDVISQAIEMQTEMGLKAQEILLRGEAIPEEMAAKMIEEKINSPEVTHHGENDLKIVLHFIFMVNQRKGNVPL